MSKTTIIVNIDPQKIANKRGMGNSDEAQRFLASEIKRLSDPYVPFQQGTLKNNTTIAKDGSYIRYNAPYAHYHWVGEIYGPNVPLGENGDEGFFSPKAPKTATGRNMSYNDGPTRGPRWAERMKADRTDDIVRSMKNYIEKASKTGGSND